MTPASTTPLRAPWPERGILPENAVLLNSEQVLDPAAGVLYALVPATHGSQSTLEAIDLRTGKVRRGESYPANGLSLASGYLWVIGTSGADGRPILDEADPGTLRTIRSVSMPEVARVPGGTPAMAVAAGPAGSVWAATASTLVRVSVRTGAVLARAVVPAGLDLTDLALGPGDLDVYASAELEPPTGAAVLEYSAGSGVLLAEVDGGPLAGASAGATLTAVPGGVWVSFRTGMNGISGLLSARSLAVISGFPTFNPAANGIGTIYGWTSGSPSAYGGGALWVATTSGLVACVNPVTGKPRAEETVPSPQAVPIFALVADRQADEVVAVIINSAGFSGVVTISPPRSCWG